jgi:hypothetical protein
MSRAFSGSGTITKIAGVKIPEVAVVRITSAGVDIEGFYVPEDPAQQSVILAIQRHERVELEVEFWGGRGTLTVTGFIQGMAEIPPRDAPSIAFTVLGVVTYSPADRKPAMSAV